MSISQKLFNDLKSIKPLILKKETKKGKGNPAALTLAVVSTEKTYTYEMLRNMEMLVVARVLSRPEPPLHARSSAFYVSKSWCRAALRWLEVQEEEQKEREERMNKLKQEAQADDNNGVNSSDNTNDKPKKAPIGAVQVMPGSLSPELLKKQQELYQQTQQQLNHF